MADWIDVAAEAEVEEGWPLGVEAQGRPVVLCRQGDRIHALDDICTHGRAYLSEGLIEEGALVCPLHQGRFAIATGRPLAPPVVEALRVYPVRIEDGRVLIQI